MKRVRFSILFLLVLFVLPFYSCIQVSASETALRMPQKYKVFVLPASLSEIGESAFEGTGGISVILPESIESVNDRAFAEMSDLEYVFVSKKADFLIADNAFYGTDSTFFGVAGSYAEDWAKAHHFRFYSILFLGLPNGPLYQAEAGNTEAEPVAIEYDSFSQRFSDWSIDQGTIVNAGKRPEMHTLALDFP